MALNTDKFLTMAANGIKTLAAAISQSTGAGDANKIVSTSATGKLDASLFPSGLGSATEAMVASEALSAGDFVNIYDNAGTRSARKADASNSARFASGYVLSAVTSGAIATVVLQGTNTALTGLTIGTRYYLSGTTPGAMIATLPNPLPTVVQLLGIAVNTSSLNFEFDDYTIVS